VPILDPYKIPRPQLFPRPWTRVLTTRDYGRSSPVHTHRARFDSDGNGITDIVASHFHRVLGGRVMPSPVDSHEHKLTGIPVKGA
jgi:hypothetical protein